MAAESGSTDMAVPCPSAAAEEQLTDAERQRLLAFATGNWVRLRRDPGMASQAAECERIVRKLSGAQTGGKVWLVIGTDRKRLVLR